MVKLLVRVGRARSIFQSLQIYFSSTHIPFPKEEQTAQSLKREIAKGDVAAFI